MQLRAARVGSGHLAPDATPPGEITRLLHRSAEGDREAFQHLISLVYSDLKGIAHRRLGGSSGTRTLDTTALVHEAYLQLVPQATASWRDRAHFFAVAATVIRHVLIDYLRKTGAEKRGGSAIHVPLNEELAGEEGRMVDLLALDEALEALAEKDTRLRDVVECRFFAGMTMKETAEALDVSKRTAERDWTRARTYLYQALAT